MNKFKKYLLVSIVCIITLLCLWGIAELTYMAYMKLSLASALILAISVLILFVMALGIISGLVVDRIMSKYEDPYGQ